VQRCQIKTGLQGCQTGRGEREIEREGEREVRRGRKLTIKIPSKLPGRDQLVINIIIETLIKNISRL
jgi:hypothetical protein